MLITEKTPAEIVASNGYLDETDTIELMSRIPRISQEFSNVQGQFTFGQPKMIEATSFAVLFGISLAILGDSGIGKTHNAEVVAKLLNVEMGKITCTPDTIVPDFIGFPRLDLATGKVEYQPGFLTAPGRVMFFVDEITRLNPKTQAALLEGLNNGEVTVDNKTYPLCTEDLRMEFFAGNPSDADGTSPLLSALVDRLQCWIIAEHLSDPDSDPDNKHAYHRAQAQRMNAQIRAYPEKGPSPDKLWGPHALKHVRNSRKVFWEAVAKTDPVVSNTADFICSSFNRSHGWMHPPQARQTFAMVELANANSLVEYGKSALPGDVWGWAANCLLGLEYEDYVTLEEKATLIRKRLKQVYDNAPSEFRQKHPGSKSGRN